MTAVGTVILCCRCRLIKFGLISDLTCGSTTPAELEYSGDKYATLRPRDLNQLACRVADQLLPPSAPQPLPMPAYGGYFAPLQLYLPDGTLPSVAFYRSGVVLMLLSDLVLDRSDLDWGVHLPLILHCVLLGMDHGRTVVHEQCKRLLLNLLMALSPSLGILSFVCSQSADRMRQWKRLRATICSYGGRRPVCCTSSHRVSGGRTSDKQCFCARITTRSFSAQPGVSGHAHTRDFGDVRIVHYTAIWWNYIREAAQGMHRFDVIFCDCKDVVMYSRGQKFTITLISYSILLFDRKVKS